MEWSLEQLSWLPEPPDDFRVRCRALAKAEDSWVRDVRFLASHRLDSPQLVQLARAIAKAPAQTPGLMRFKLGLLSNATTDLIAPCLAASAARHGLLLEVIHTPFDQAVQQAMDPDSRLNRSAPNAVVLAVDSRALPLDRGVEAALEQVNAIREAIHRHSGASVIVQNIARIPAPLFGSFDRTLAGSSYRRVLDYNKALEETIAGSGDCLIDTASLAEDVGLEKWHDLAQWYTARLPFSQQFVPLYAEVLARLIGALRGKSRKCLVLDLDNTLWGGVIGDDGLDGLVLGQGNPRGEAFLAVQRTALDLRERGIVLAVSSKNDDDVARGPFRTHPDMLLREEHIAVFQANWRDKASNLKAIAEALDIGTDALVLLDDNPAERAFVRGAMPEAGVPELPPDPALYPRALLFGGYFEAVTFSREDRARADAYQANARRAELKVQIGDVFQFLQSLDMTIGFAPFHKAGRGRITQLINRSNQFNLTTRRYGESEIAAMETDPSLFTLQVRVADRFGDNGMICAIVCRDSGRAWEVDTWVMSCRVLGRRVEEAVLAEIARAAKAAGKAAIVGEFIDSGRNGLVKDHYEKLGFVCERADKGHTRWRLDVAGYKAPTLPFAIKRDAEVIGDRSEEKQKAVVA
jgi:FkbH-like protein